MLRNQEKFQTEMKGEMKEVVSRLTEIEQRILEQMKSSALPRNVLCAKTGHDDASNTDSKEAVNPTLDQLEHILKELHCLQEHSKSADASEVKRSRSPSLHHLTFGATRKQQGPCYKIIFVL